MGTNECSQPASKSSWGSQDFGDVSMVLKPTIFASPPGHNELNCTNAYKSKNDSYAMLEATKMAKRKWNRPKSCMCTYHVTESATRNQESFISSK